MRSVPTRDLALIAITVLVAVIALVLVIVADGLTRFAMVLVLFSSTASIGLAVYRLRHQRQQR